MHLSQTHIHTGHIIHQSHPLFLTTLKGFFSLELFSLCREREAREQPPPSRSEPLGEIAFTWNPCANDRGPKSSFSLSLFFSLISWWPLGAHARKFAIDLNEIGMGLSFFFLHGPFNERSFCRVQCTLPDMRDAPSPALSLTAAKWISWLYISFSYWIVFVFIWQPILLIEFAYNFEYTHTFVYFIWGLGNLQKIHTWNITKIRLTKNSQLFIRKKINFYNKCENDSKHQIYYSIKVWY